MRSCTTISLIKRLRVAASSSVMLAYSEGLHPLFCVIGKLDFIGQPLSALGHFCFKFRLLGLCLFQHGVEVLLTDTPCNHIFIKPHYHFVQNLNPFLVPCKGAFHCFPLFPLLGFTGIGQAVSNRFPVHQGSSGTFPDFPQHMTVKGVIINPVLGAVVLSKGIVGLAGVNLLGDVLRLCSVPSETSHTRRILSVRQTG